LVCPEDGCKVNVDDRDIKDVLSESQYLKYN